MNVSNGDGARLVIHKRCSTWPGAKIRAASLKAALLVAGDVFAVALLWIVGKTNAPGSCSSSWRFRRAVYPCDGAQRLPVIRPAEPLQAHPVPTALRLALAMASPSHKVRRAGAALPVASGAAPCRVDKMCCPMLVESNGQSRKRSLMDGVWL